MNLAAPIGLAAAVLAVPLVAWYVLRSRRPTQVVGSTFLWARTDRSVAAAVPWQRFRPDVTFWLVLLALLAGALALARPFVTVTAELGDHTVMILDASGSMLAQEDGPSRLELARRTADDLVDKLGPGQEVSVVEAGSRARVLLSGSADPRAIRDALSSVRPTHGPADLVDAFTLASALERPGQATLVHLFTDGEVPDGAAAALPAGTIVTSVGSERPNLAMTRLEAVPLGAGSSQVFVQVRNFGALPATGRLTLAVDGTDVVEEALELGPRATDDRVLQVQGGDGQVLTGRIEVSGTDVTGTDQTDALTLDDHAFAILSAPRELDVVLATPGNVFLQAALESVPGVALETADAVPADLAEVDLLVVDRVAGPDAPTVPTVYVAASALPVGITAGAEVERPALTFQAPDHELLADVDLSEVAIATAPRIDAPALTPIAAGPNGPLILAGRLDGVPVVLIGFDLLASNLPLQPAWPVLVANMVSWLAGPPVIPPVPAGSLIRIAAPQGATGITVSPPSGDPVRLDPTRPRLQVDQVGVWRTTFEGEFTESVPTVLAVNPDPAESDLSRPQPAPVESGDPEEAADATGAPEGRRSFGQDILVIVLLLAAAEWLWAFGIRPWRAARRRERGLPARPARRWLRWPWKRDGGGGDSDGGGRGGHAGGDRGVGGGVAAGGRDDREAEPVAVGAVARRGEDSRGAVGHPAPSGYAPPAGPPLPDRSAGDVTPGNATASDERGEAR